MNRKLLAIGGIAVIAIVGLFVFEHATSAQRPDRDSQGQRGNRQGGQRGGTGMMNPAAFVDTSWIDLTFTVKVDDETLVKARPVYQTAREQFTAKMEELGTSDDRRAAMAEMQNFAATVGKEFQMSLKEILTEEQMTKLNALTKKRQMEQETRRNRWRQGARRGGGGGGSR